MGRLPHANATIVPFQLTKMRPARKNTTSKTACGGRGQETGRQGAEDEDSGVVVEGAIPIGEIQWRQKARIAGRVTSVEVQPWRGAQVLSCTLVDRTGSVTLVFTRRDVPGIETGAQIVAEGTVGEHEGRLALLNPIHEVLKRTPLRPAWPRA